MLKHLQVHHAETFTGTPCCNIFRYAMLKQSTVNADRDFLQVRYILISIAYSRLAR